MTWRRGAIVAVMIGLMALVMGCTNTPNGGDSSVLRVGYTLEPGTLDLTTSDAASIPQLLLYNVYETLVKMDSDGRIQPLLATDYTVSDDGKTYTFNLDPKAKFATGTPVNAQAVVDSINRMRKATSETMKRNLGVITQVEANGEHSVVICLSRPSNLWLYEMTSSAGVIVDPAITDLATMPMGSGPYMFDNWVKGDRITLKKNPDYWGTPPVFNQVVFRYFSDPNAMVAAMLSADLDVIAELTSPDSLAMFADTSKYLVIKGTTNGEVVLGFNHSRTDLANKSVRQAICYAIDRQGLVDAVWGGQGELIGSMVVPTDPYYQDLSNQYPYDPEKAKQLLAQAGIKDLKLTLRIPITPYSTAAATFIASQLREVGISVAVEELEFSSRWLPEVFMAGNYDMTIVAHVEARDIVAFANPEYYWHYDNPSFQARIQAADEATPSLFVPLMQQAAQMLADDAAADWLFVFPNLIVAKAGLNGIGQNATSLSFDVTNITTKG